MSYTFKGFEQDPKTGLGFVFESRAANSAKAPDGKPAAVEEVIPFNQYVRGDFDVQRIGYAAQRDAAAAIILKGIDL